MTYYGTFSTITVDDKVFKLAPKEPLTIGTSQMRQIKTVLNEGCDDSYAVTLTTDVQGGPYPVDKQTFTVEHRGVKVSELSLLDDAVLTPKKLRNLAAEIQGEGLALAEDAAVDSYVARAKESLKDLPGLPETGRAAFYYAAAECLANQEGCTLYKDRVRAAEPTPQLVGVTGSFEGLMSGEDMMTDEESVECCEEYEEYDCYNCEDLGCQDCCPDEYEEYNDY